MLSGWQTIWYFTWRGPLYGAGLGAIAGTFIYPVIATVAGFAYGGGVGLVMGILLGIGVHFYNRRAYRQQMDFEEYQTNLVTGAGLATALVTAIPLFALLAPVAGLAAAYVTHRYTDDHAHHIIKRKNEGLLPNTQQHMEKLGVVEKFTEYFESRSKWVFLAGLAAVIVTGAIITIIEPSLDIGSGIMMTIGGIAGWIMYSLLLNILLGFTNGMFIQMLNRVAFSPDWTKEQYKRRVMVTAGLFTLVITPVVGLLVGAPILALIASLAARDYADWYYEGHVDNTKHDAARLAEEYQADDDDESSNQDVEAEREAATHSEL